MSEPRPPLNLEVDGKPVQVPAGSTVMDATRELGIYVPHFCYHRKLSIAANCRMCLVQVEKAPKPLPACATPATEGMKVWTHSDAATDAQKGVMEFLLINHPLDCPICDQGGECQLQDLAVGYGASSSRYDEPKRVVLNKYLGPLIATDMTRCIHCTRCVRFGLEIAGVLELGMANRGENSEIMTFVGKTVNSELSGNMIDLCPVGALTSKPFRYSARTWELVRRKTISPHDGLGSNLIAHVKNDRVMRVLPSENEAINECWISDRDRFSYDAVNSEDRLLRPMIKRNGQWEEADWQIALEYVVRELGRARATAGGSAIGALASPQATLEELYLLQKLARGLESDNIDFRLRQSDFSVDGKSAGAPWLGMSIADFAALDRYFVIGSYLRKDQPLLSHRVRQATKRGAELSLLHAVDDDLLMRVVNKAIVPPSAMVAALSAIVAAASEAAGVAADESLQGVVADDAARAIAASLAGGKAKGIFLGSLAQHHPEAARLHALAQRLADITGAKLGFLTEAANSIGGYVAGAMPRNGGMNARAMLAGEGAGPLQALVLLHAEPELDSADPGAAHAALAKVPFVVALSAFRGTGAMDYADVLLPIAPFTETAGTFINCEGRAQSFNGVALTAGESRPAWKVLRVLGTMLGLKGFDYTSIQPVRAEALGRGELASRLSNAPALGIDAARPANGHDTSLERIAEVPIYFADPLVRRSRPLQKTLDARPPAARMNARTLARLGLTADVAVRVVQNGGEAMLASALDESVPDNCVRLATAHESTRTLGSMFGAISVEAV